MKSLRELVNIVSTDKGIGRLRGDTVELLEVGTGSVRVLLQHANWREILTAAPVVSEASLQDVALSAPLEPGDFWLVGSNYVGRADPPPARPAFYLRATSSLADPGSRTTVGSDLATDPDGEMAVVIGRPAWRVREAQAWSYIAGVTACNDVTARSLLDSGWGAAVAKSHPGFGALGASLRIVDDDPGPLSISLTVDGQVRQRGTTQEMLFGVPELVARLSARCCLAPGDVIATGASTNIADLTKTRSFDSTMRVEVEGVLPLTTHLVRTS